MLFPITVTLGRLFYSPGDHPAIEATLKKQPKGKKSAAKKPAAKAKGELRKPQLRILAALAKSKEPMDRGEIAEKAKCDRAWLTEWIGAIDPATRKRNDKKSGCVSLLTRGFVKANEGDGVTTYTITASGRKALAAAK